MICIFKGCNCTFLKYSLDCKYITLLRNHDILVVDYDRVSFINITKWSV